VVVVEDFVDGYGDRQVGGCVEGVALGVESFGFVGACDFVRGFTL
jgi:hypothetical protein